jgi:hypothetical protein
MNIRNKKIPKRIREEKDPAIKNLKLIIFKLNKKLRVAQAILIGTQNHLHRVQNSYKEKFQQRGSE